MKNIKRIIIGLFIFVAFLFVFSGFNAKADPVATSSEIQVTGASVRTSGNAGIRFVGTVGSYDTTNVKAYGIAIAYGEQNVEDIILGATVGGKSILTATVNELDGEGKFYIVLYGVPEASYAQDVTARAYVILNDDSVVYSTASKTRNLAQVAIAAKNDGFGGGLIDTVVDNIEDNYKYITTTTTNEFVISDVYTLDYSYSNLKNLWAEFISDYNEATGATLTTAATASEFFNSFKIGTDASTATKVFPANCNAVKMFSGARMVKWGWILQYLKDHYEAIHIKNQADALLREDRTCVTVYDGKVLGGYRLEHLAASIWNFFNEGSATLSYNANKFPNGEASYSSVQWPKFDNSRAKRIGTSITLPLTAQSHTGYNLTGFSDASNSYSLGGSYILTSSNNVFKPVYTVISYSITYYSNSVLVDLNPATYNIETATFSLPTLEDNVDYCFAGWYNNPGFDGAAIDSIAVGSTGNKTFYACWVENTPTPVELTSAQISIIETKSPTMYVSNSFVGGKYIINGTTYNYSSGDVLFKTISAALAEATSSDVIYVLPGTYSEDLSLSTIGLTIIGNNVDINGNAARNTETTITGVVTITGAGTEFNGFNMSTTGRISIKANNVKISSLLSTYSGDKNTDFIMLQSTQSGTVVEKTKATFSSTSRFVACNSKDWVISNARVSDCTATGYKYATPKTNGSYVDGIKFQNISGTITINNNRLDGFDQFPVFLGSSANTATRIDIIDNHFSNGGNYQEVISIRASKATTYSNIIGNTFEGSRGIYVINIRGTITDGYSKIAYNKFLDTTTASIVTKYLTSATYSEAFIVDHNYFATAPTSSSVQTTKSITNTHSTTAELDTAYAAYKESLN